MPPSAATKAAREERVCCVLDALVPTMQQGSLPHGAGGTRWVGPPWTAILRSGKSNNLEIRLGERLVLATQSVDVGNPAARVPSYRRDQLGA
jgi:hypothetical protein